MNLVGFEKIERGEIKEYLPQNIQYLSDKEKRVLFIHMFNNYVDKEFRFAQEEILEIFDGKNLYEIFKNKIENLSKLNKFVNLTYIFLENKLLCDVSDMFLHLVYERAKLVNKDKKILLYEDRIIIEENDKNKFSTLLLPSYTLVDKNSLSTNEIIQNHIETSVNILKTTKIRQIFLVYPKTFTFNKHINLNFSNKLPLKEKEYRVKMIPYSFSFCIQKQKKTKKRTLLRSQKWQ